MGASGGVGVEPGIEAAPRLNATGPAGLRCSATGCVGMVRVGVGCEPAAATGATSCCHPASTRCSW